MTGRTPRIAIFSSGLWSLRQEISLISGMTPVLPGASEAVAGWGHKPTARLARRFARRFHMPYIGFEDGLLR